MGKLTAKLLSLAAIILVCSIISYITSHVYRHTIDPIERAMQVFIKIRYNIDIEPLFEAIDCLIS